MNRNTTLKSVGNALMKGVESAARTGQRAAGAANTVSKQAQSAQGAFNQNSANIANSISDNRLAAQYDFNAAQAAMANDYNMQAWNTAAAWNEEMWEKQAQFNAEQAELNRQFNHDEAILARTFNHDEAEIARNWTTEMDNTKYARAMTDMQNSGLNPILAYGGISSAPSGAVASGGMASGSPATVSGASISSAAANMAAGGLIGGNQANEGNYTGQMEYLSGYLGLLSAAFSGISTALSAMGNLGDFGEGLTKGLAGILEKIPTKPFEGGLGNFITEKNKKNANFSHSKKGGKIENYYH